jgi:concanavalin A-like lectin/glucanase superfamily protein
MSALRTVVLADSPYAFWPMGFASPYSDLSGNSHPLTAGSGSPAQVAGIVPGDTDPDAYSLHTTGAEYLTLPFTASPTAFSFELWVKTSGTCTIWGSYPYCYGGIDGSGRIFLTLVGGATYTGTITTLADGNLHHLVWTFATGTLQMYVDGSADGTGVAPAGLATGSLFGYGGGAWLNGSLGDVAEYSTTLTSGQVTAHYNAGITGPLVRTAGDGIAEVTESSGRLMSLLRGLGDVLASLVDFGDSHNTVNLVRTAADTTSVITDAAVGVVAGHVHLVRTAHDTTSAITDSTRIQTIGHLEAQFHPEIVFKIFDLYTKEYFGMLPLDGVTFQCRYNTQIGTLQGTLSLDPLPNTPVRPEAIRLRRMLIVEVNEWPLWVGQIDRLAWDSESSLYQVRAEELWTIFDSWPLQADAVYPVTEQIAIFKDLFENYVLPGVLPGGLTEVFVPSNIHRNESIIGSAYMLFGNFVRAHGISIFDGYQVRGPRVLYDDATQTPRLQLEAASPTIGQRYGGSNTPRFRYLPQGGEILKITFSDDAATGAGYATMVVGTSVITGNPQPPPLTAMSVNTALIAAGWPPQVYVLPSVQNYDQATLQARCDAEMWRRAVVYGAPAVTITLAALWQSRLLPGDDCVLILQDGLRWPVKQVFVYRVTGYDVDVEAETAALIFDPSSVAILTAFGPELLDEQLTQMPGTTNQNPSNGPSQDQASPYYPSGQGPGVNLPTNFPTHGGGPPPFVQLLYRATQDGLTGGTVSFSSPVYSGSAPGTIASLPGAAQTNGQSVWFNTVWTGTITGGGVPITLDLIWTSSVFGVVARKRIKVQAGTDPTAFSVALSFTAWSYNPILGSVAPSLLVSAASGAWVINDLDAEFQASYLAL